MYLVHINPYYLFHSPCVQHDPELEKLYLLDTAKIIHLLIQVIKFRCSYHFHKISTQAYGLLVQPKLSGKVTLQVGCKKRVKHKQKTNLQDTQH